MIIIKDIVVEKVPDNIIEIKFNKMASTVSIPEYGYLQEDYKSTIEMVRGQQFRNAEGEKICIGMTEKVQNALALPLSSFDSMNKTISRLHSQLNEEIKLRKSIVDGLREMNFWRRLKYLFTSNFS